MELQQGNSSISLTEAALLDLVTGDADGPAPEETTEMVKQVHALLVGAGQGRLPTPTLGSVDDGFFGRGIGLDHISSGRDFPYGILACFIPWLVLVALLLTRMANKTHAQIARAGA